MSAVVAVSREFADRLADVTKLLDAGEATDEALAAASLGVQLIPGGTAAAVTVAVPEGRAHVRLVVRPAPG